MPSDQRPPNRLLQTLSAEDFEAVRTQLQVVDLKRETLLIDAGRPLTHVWLPHSGVVSLMINLSEGQTVEIAVIGNDGIIGAADALGGGVSLTDAVVLCPGQASMLSVVDLKAAIGRNVAWNDLISRHQQALLAQVQQSVACNASHSVEERLSRLLLRIHDRWRGATLPMTQDLLARMLGVQRNAVSIVAHVLQQSGIIRYSRGQIEIVDRDKLQRAACECYEAVRTKQAALFD